MPPKGARGSKNLPYSQTDRTTYRPDIDIDSDTFYRIETLSLYWECSRAHIFRMLISFALDYFEDSMRAHAKGYWMGTSTPDVSE